MKATRRAALALTALALGSSAGCTQVAQLRPVAGGEITAVRNATSIVLVEQGVAVDVMPECTFDEPTYTCTGTTETGTPIIATAQVLAPFGATTDQWGAQSPADISLMVVVDRTQIYVGSVQDALVGQGQS